MIAYLKQPQLHFKAMKIALIVGSLLCIINHGDAIIQGEMTKGRWLKLILTYFVPYGVSLYSAIGALKSKKVS